MITVNLKRTLDDSYPIHIEAGLLRRLPAILKSSYPASRYVVICDSVTKRLFGATLARGLQKSGLPTLVLSVPAGERSKTDRYKSMLEEAMLRAGCDRESLVIALGGGVVGDLAGYVSATYMRGIRYVQVPTTTLAMVDSSIGGKTGIDTPSGKNLVGAFWQPEAVFADPVVASGLSHAQRSDGLVEAAKMFMTSDKKSFGYLEKNLAHALAGDTAVLTSLVRRAVAIKARIVSGDEREGNERMVLNFGHTVGHALEKLSRYRLSHGAAVALGILVEARIALGKKLLSREDFETISELLKRLGSDSVTLKQWTPEAIIKATRGDKKSVAGHVRYVLLRRIGAVHRTGGAYAHVVPEREVARAVRAVTESL